MKHIEPPDGWEWLPLEAILQANDKVLIEGRGFIETRLVGAKVCDKKVYIRKKENNANQV